jgi:N-acetylmuramoyl-L-alanine amidase
MTPWNEAIIPVNEYTRPGIIRTFTRNVVWHWTANPLASAYNHSIYFGKTLPAMNYEVMRQYQSGEITWQQAEKLLIYASANFFIDPIETLLIIPIEEVSYHASQANPYSVGVELCIEKDGSFHPATIEKAIQLGVELCKMYNITPSDFMRHFDVTRKNCPKPWVDDVSQWEVFKLEVDRRLKGKGESENMLTLTQEVREALVASLQRAYERGLLGDYRFVEKAYNSTLTRSELDVANNIIIVNSALI